MTNLKLTGCEGEGEQSVLRGQVHHGHRVGGAQAEAGDDGDPRCAVVTAGDRAVGLEPGDVHGVVLLEHGELPEPGHVQLPI